MHKDKSLIGIELWLWLWHWHWHWRLTVQRRHWGTEGTEGIEAPKVRRHRRHWGPATDPFEGLVDTAKVQQCKHRGVFFLLVVNVVCDYFRDVTTPGTRDRLNIAEKNTGSSFFLLCCTEISYSFCLPLIWQTSYRLSGRQAAGNSECTGKCIQSNSSFISDAHSVKSSSTVRLLFVYCWGSS